MAFTRDLKLVSLTWLKYLPLDNVFSSQMTCIAINVLYFFIIATTAMYNESRNALSFPYFLNGMV